MISYRDMTFCDSWGSCVKGDDCSRAITEDVLKRAEDIGLPLSVAIGFSCYEEIANTPTN